MRTTTKKQRLGIISNKEKTKDNIIRGTAFNGIGFEKCVLIENSTGKIGKIERVFIETVNNPLTDIQSGKKVLADITSLRVRI